MPTHYLLQTECEVDSNKYGVKKLIHKSKPVMRTNNMWKSSITEITINVTNPLNTLLQMHK